MDWHLIDRVNNMLNFVTEGEVMTVLVTEDGLTPGRAFIIIKAAVLLRKG